MGSKWGGDRESRSEISLDRDVRLQSQRALRGAGDAYGGFQNSPLPSTYTGISAPRQRGMDEILAMAQGGTAVPQNVLNEYNKTMSGGYLDAASNPYLQGIVGRSMSEAMGSQVSGAMKGGRFGSGVMANAMADAGQETASRLYGAQYEAERARMNQALQLAPQMNELQYADQYKQGFVGQQMEEDQAARQMEATRQYLWPMEAAGSFANVISGNPLMAETTTTGTQTQPFDWGAAVGGAGTAIGGLAMMCHVAAEFFGWFTPEWFDARDWIVHGWEGNEADSFRSHYAEHGPDMAKRVREDPAYSDSIRPLFDWARERGSEMREST